MLRRIREISRRVLRRRSVVLLLVAVLVACGVAAAVRGWWTLALAAVFLYVGVLALMVGERLQRVLRAIERNLRHLRVVERRLARAQSAYESVADALVAQRHDDRALILSTFLEGTERVFSEVRAESDRLSAEVGELRTTTTGVQDDILRSSRAVRDAIESGSHLDAVRSDLRGMDSRLRNLQGMGREHESALRHGFVDAVRDVEALFQLFSSVSPRSAFPPLGSYAMFPRSLVQMLALVREQQPQLIVELGGGASTVWLGYLAESYGGRVLSIDHLDEFATRTRSAVMRHGLGRTVQIVTAPLEAIELDGESFDWYSTSVFEDVDGIELLVVDGPPARSGRLARYPALSVLRERLASGALIVLDDAQRPDEGETISRWLQDSDDLTSVHVPADGLGVFQVRAAV